MKSFLKNEDAYMFVVKYTFPEVEPRYSLYIVVLITEDNVMCAKTKTKPKNKISFVNTCMKQKIRKIVNASTTACIYNCTRNGSDREHVHLYFHASITKKGHSVSIVALVVLIKSAVRYRRRRVLQF